MDAKVPLKFVYKDSVVRVSADAASISVGVLQRLVLDAFGVQFVALKYTDPEGDLVSISTDEDVHTALALFAKADGSFATMRVTAVPTACAVLQETVVEPVVKAMEHLVETLDAAKASVKSDQWVQRAASQANAHLCSEALQSAVADVRESFHAVRELLQEIPFDQMVKDASTGIKSAASSAAVLAKEVVEDAKNEKLVQDAAEGIKTAAAGISKFAKDAVEDAKKDPNVKDLAEGLKTVAGGISEAAKEAVDELASKVSPYLAQTGAAVAPAPAAAAVDSDWEQVAEQQLPAPSVAAVQGESDDDEIVEVVVSDEEKKWAEQLMTIRDIVPDVATACAVEQLERANGNVEVALNALVEDM